MTTMEELETERVTIRDVRADDLASLLDVSTSNPQYLQLTEGSAGEPGHYDIQMLARDAAVAQMTPGRHMATIFLKETGDLVGVLDWIEENPSDGMPWVGVVMIHADWQRRGLASEALEALAESLRSRGSSALRAGVIERNHAGRALALRLGFEVVSTTVKRLASGDEDVIVLELRL